MSKSDPAAAKRARIKAVRWVVTIFLVTIVVSGSISLLSDILMENSSMAVAFLILLVIILIGIIFDIVIFPEDSTNGYLDQLEGFHGGFVSLCDALKRKGIDVPVYCTFFKKKEGVYVVDCPVLYSEISRGTHSREEVAKKLLDRTNELSRGEYEKKSVMVS